MHILGWVIIAVVAGGIVIALFGWDRYRGRKQADSDARPTGEVFVDPATGERMRVWFNAATGQREYRAE